jgi:hypothetical protein
VLVFDPLSPATARTVILIAGAAGTDNLAATTSWGSNSTLVVDAERRSAAGSPSPRDGGTISVGPVGATLQINPGASVSLGGTVDALSNGSFTSTS